MPEINKQDSINNLNCFTRWEFFSKLINDNGYKNIVEVGMYAGEMAFELIKNKNIDNYIMIDNNPNTEFYSFLSKLPNNIGIDRKYIFMKMKSIEASKFFPDNSLDLVFIDADHSYESVLNDIKNWFPKVKKGGIISGHDYEHPSFYGVKKAVDEFFGNKKFNLETDMAGESLSVKIWWKKI